MPERPLFIYYIFQNIINLSIFKIRLAIVVFPKGVY